MRRWLCSLTLVLATLVLAGPFGCPVSHVDLCEAQMQATCQFQFRCCKAEERLTGMFVAFPYMANEGECIERATGYCKLLSAANDDAAAAGRLRFDGDKGKECVAALEAARDSCDIVALGEATTTADGDPGPCAEVSEGLVEDGEACASSGECASEGAYCDIDYEDPDLNEELGTRDGECVGPGDVGDDCESRPCQDGLECIFDGTDSSYTCTALPGVGEPCPSFQCQEGLGCAYDTVAGENRCQQPAGLGEDCAGTGLCEVPLVCTYDQTTFEQTCEAPPDVGEPCPMYQCALGAFCNDTAGTPGTCEAQVAAGGECDPDLYDQCAGEDSYCDDAEAPPVCRDYGAPDPVDPDQCTGN
ncbi:MAG: hypothetical protein HYS27_10375 [Deltaproteobacteria bacterium]|nr:hypothetical protein [Deltaproteobacteria bacterium]